MQEAILEFLRGFDPNGENIQVSHKQEAAKKCNCTILEVENALAKYTWAMEAQKKIEKLKEEEKPMPTSSAEVQKLMRSSPLDLARSNMAKSGQISRNALSRKAVKRDTRGAVERTEGTETMRWSMNTPNPVSTWHVDHLSLNCDHFKKRGLSKTNIVVQISDSASLPSSTCG